MSPIDSKSALAEKLETEDAHPLRDVWIFPRPRVVGPGRREREYQDRVRALEAELERTSRAFDVVGAVERGSERLLDRLERDLERERAEERTLRQAHHRLILAFGAMQRENELLRASLEARPLPELASARGTSTLQRSAHAFVDWCARALGALGMHTPRGRP